MPRRDAVGKGDERQSKRDRFQSKTPGKASSDKAGKNRWMIFGGMGVGAVAIAAVLLFGGFLGSGDPQVASTAPGGASGGLAPVAATSNHEPFPLVTADGSGTVRFAVAEFDDNEAHHFTYMHDGEPIEFFVLKSVDGVVRAAFNACDVCYGSKRGYTQDGDFMVCNNCGLTFPSNRINDVKGGCNPAPLEREIQGDELVISVVDLATGERFF
ncbi:MAG: Fe-S-containing protein [Candidatus Bipolaricaulia bacterium]